ncbi:uncharacterized protein LOC134821783 isoform X3 [Bolinopsis microptera]|uniref:uncharacterized protein LOC134821783 isoform X3 n=1 Tax=Bolinopsis microptera TaxID=2820187 RepID=UPI003079FADB
MILLALLTLLPLSSSLDIVKRYDWGAEPTDTAGVSLTRITDIVIGNEVVPGAAECTTMEACQIFLRSLQQRDIGAGNPDLKFNFYVSSMGDVYEGVGWTRQGSFTSKYASSALGIAYLGDFSSGISAGAKQAILDIIKLGYQAEGINIDSQFCMMFTCVPALKSGAGILGPSCPGGDTYNDISNWEPLPGVQPLHVNRPCGCGKLDPPSNGRVEYASYDVGSKATYFCLDGFELIGTNEQTCEVSGAWGDLSINSPYCVDPSRGLIIVPKKVWDVVSEEAEFIEGGFPIATFFVDVASDAYCVDDSDCRLKLKQLKKDAWDNNQEKDVLCNFYIAKTGIVYEGRGWGIKGAYTADILKTQGICFLGLDAVTSKKAEHTLFKFIKDARDAKKVSYDGDGFCFQTKCPGSVDAKFCRTVQNWMMRSDSPQYTNKYCLPDPIPEDTRAPALSCRHKKKHDTWLNYQGTKSVSVSGCPCLAWSDQSIVQHHFYPEVFPYAELESNFCRNPDMSDSGPWCITDSSCGNGGMDSCAIPQCEGEYCFEENPFGCAYHQSQCYLPFCTAAVSFSQHSAMRYTLQRTKSTYTDKLSMTIKPDTLNARLIRIEGGMLMDDPELANFWDISLVNGTVKVIMHLTHGDNIAEFETVSEEVLPLGTSSTIQILRKNHKVLLRINGVDTIEKISVNFTEIGDNVMFFKPQEYILGHYLTGDLFQGCMADAVFNRDDLFAVATGSLPARGEMIMEEIDDDGCSAVLPFLWGDIDIVTTPPPTTKPPTTQPIMSTAQPVVNKKSNLPYIIIGVVILVIIIVLLIGCILFKRHNRDKGVYKVDEAITTKWDWKKGILPVLSETKQPGSYDKINANPDESPEVFA